MEPVGSSVVEEVIPTHQPNPKKQDLPFSICALNNKVQLNVLFQSGQPQTDLHRRNLFSYRKWHLGKLQMYQGAPYEIAECAEPVRD
ncbi:MAG: hypothetical protein K1Y36_15860 [Blastocatellia bacterium]|nr:hypothetical protein [Blastocatellia bacterium]